MRFAVFDFIGICGFNCGVVLFLPGSHFFLFVYVVKE